VGEPRDAPPPFIAEIIHAHRNDFGRYPPIAGTIGFRAAVADWLGRRFNLPATGIDPDRQILPLNGSREGLFFAVPPLVPDSKNGGRPVVLVPNPFYVTYPTAVLAAGAEPYYVPARARPAFFPIAGVPKRSSNARWRLFLFALRSGRLRRRRYWRSLFNGDRYDFTVLADECYCEIYDAEPPVGALPSATR
jgi:aspartate/methionine/tyrosine aminotransferase